MLIKACFYFQTVYKKYQNIDVCKETLARIFIFLTIPEGYSKFSADSAIHVRFYQILSVLYLGPLIVLKFLTSWMLECSGCLLGHFQAW